MKIKWQTEHPKRNTRKNVKKNILLQKYRKKASYRALSKWVNFFLNNSIIRNADETSHAMPLVHHVKVKTSIYVFYHKVKSTFMLHYRSHQNSFNLRYCWLSILCYQEVLVLDFSSNGEILEFNNRTVLKWLLHSMQRSWVLYCLLSFNKRNQEEWGCDDARCMKWRYIVLTCIGVES